MRAKAVAEAALKREVEVNGSSKEAIKSDLEDLRQKLLGIIRRHESESDLRAERERQKAAGGAGADIYREPMVTSSSKWNGMLTKKLGKLEEYNEHVHDKENQAVTGHEHTRRLQRRLEVERVVRKLLNSYSAELKSRGDGYCWSASRPGDE